MTWPGGIASTMAESVPSGQATQNAAADEQIGRLLNHYLDRRERGEPVNRDLLKAEQPELAEVLAQHLSVLQAVSPSADAIKELLSKRVLSPSSSSEGMAELGHYRVQGIIGRGGMGIVLRAIERPLGRPVALKVLRPELAVDYRALVRFEHEAKAAAALRHPNIVTVYACGAVDGTHYLAMEAVDGPSLAQRLLHEPPPSAEETRRIFRELLTGLAAAHEAGLVHRDIKPSNILLDGPDRRVKIADFGLARITASQTRITMPLAAIGTPEYMSPEQARGEEDVDCRTDLYSAGVVLFEMLTGRVPFKGASGSAVIHHILHDEPPEPTELSPGSDRALSALCLNLLAKRREDRPASAEKVLELLNRPRFRWRRPSPAARRRRALVGWAVVLAGLGGALALDWIQGGTWLLARLGLMPDVLQEVRVELRGESPTATISARFGDSLEWTKFHTFPGEERCVDRVLKLPGATHRLAVLAGINPPIAREGLWALDAKGRLRWGLDLGTPDIWPDCRDTSDFVVKALVPLEFQGRGAADVLIVASDLREYPSYAAVLDLKSRSLSNRQWHLGQLNFVAVGSDLLGPGRPGIVLTGANNKLDGWDDGGRPGDLPALVPYDWVPVIMVLDFAALNGNQLLDVPRSNGRVPWLPVTLPLSYRYLEGAAGERTLRRLPGSSEVVASGEDRVLALGKPRIVQCSPTAEDERCIEIPLTRGNSGEGGALFVLDADLEIRNITLHSTELTGRDSSYWEERFRLLVQGGRYVGESQ